jgi:hypothetical protein
MNKLGKTLYLFIMWHSVQVVCDAAYWQFCARGFFWSLVTRGSDVCRVLKNISQ